MTKILSCRISYPRNSKCEMCKEEIENGTSSLYLLLQNEGKFQDVYICEKCSPKK